MHQPVIVLDIETSGLSPRDDEIIEIAAMRTDPTKSRQAAFQQLIRPRRPIRNNIVALTGITNDELSDSGVSLSTALTRLASFIGDLPIVAFNVDFDARFLTAAFAQENVAVTKRGHCCALRLARRTWPGLPSYKLSALAALHQLDTNGSHRALHDTVRCAHIYYRALGAKTQAAP